MIQTSHERSHLDENLAIGALNLLSRGLEGLIANKMLLVVVVLELLGEE